MGLTHAKNTGNRRGIAMVVAGVFALSGIGFIAYAAMNQPEHPPEVPRSAAPAVTTTPTDGPTDSSVEAAREFAVRNGTAPTTAAPAATASPNQIAAPQPPKRKPARVMLASPPVSLSIPAINVKSSGMLHVGQTAQGTLQVPPPGPDYNKVGWYRNSPMPGTLGPAVLVGHIDSAKEGPSVFFRLAALRRGDLIRITREDKTVAVFKVDEIKRFKKVDFPTQLVYGNTDHAALRIITCGGPFDRDSGSYIDNTVVLASLI
jgi:hypothetical protein